MKGRTRLWATRVAILIAATGATIVVSAGVARADVTGRQVVTSTIRALPGGVSNTVATCPAGMVNTGGGFSYSPAILVVNSSIPATSGQGWFVQAFNPTRSFAMLTAYAVCAFVPGRQIVSSSFLVFPGQGWDTFATCPDGTVMVGGGYTFAATTGLYVDDSNPTFSGQEWYVHAINGTQTNRLVTAYAVCAANDVTPTPKIMSGAIAVSPGQGWDTVITCPHDTVNTGGGHSFAIPGLIIDVSHPIDPALDQGWYVHVVNHTSDVQLVGVYSVCEAGN